MNDRNGLDYLDKLDAFLDGDDNGLVPLELLEQRGVVMPDPDSLDDTQLHELLTTVIREMSNIGLFLNSTDHFSDRELYARLQDDVLLEPTLLFPDNLRAAECHDFLGSGGDEDNEVYLAIYATEEDRQRWQKDFPRFVLPPKRPRPFDRDRTLPKMEDRFAMAEEEQ